ncbi:MAG: efflux RND transporter permease subunit, partial [Halieaceae bacterium]|nr:efflux RND transporter permease subunit [Halieaceae bacterium]
MWISDTSVKRPVLAMVVSSLLFAFGVISFDRLPLREYPDIDPPIISIRTVYPGANAAVVENKITELIEDRIAGISGVKSMNSTSRDGRSNIRMEFHLGRDIDAAANDVRDRVSRILNNLPDEAEPPEVLKAEDDESVLYWIHLVEPNMDTLELTDFVRRYLEDRFAALEGVARIRIGGGQSYAMRIWLDRDALVARQLTVADVEGAIRRENIELPAGTMKSLQRDFVIRVERSYANTDDFRALVIHRGADGHLVRLGEVARVELSSAEHRSMFRGNGKPIVSIGVVKQSTANALSVSRRVEAEIRRLNQQLPAGMHLVRSMDNSIFVEAAIGEVYQTLFIAAALVVLVIFVFLGDPRSLVVPMVTVPISLVATFTLLYALDYSINLLTLLALVLSIGLVVDDCIVVLENIHRRLVQGESPLLAAYRGSRQVGFAVLATTGVLIAVFVPITLLEGNIGRLFSEFAVAMAVAVGFSSLVALTVVPVICARLLRADTIHNPLADTVERLSGKMEALYRAILRRLLHMPLLTVVVLVLSVVASVWLFRHVPQEYAPKEDRGMLFVMALAPEGSSYEYTLKQALEVEQRLMPLVDSGDIKRLLIRAPGRSAFNQAYAIIVLGDWDSGRRDTQTILQDVRTRVSDIPGATIHARAPRSLGGGTDNPVQFVVGGNTYDELAQWQEILLSKVAENPGLRGVDTDFKPTKPQLRVAIDRDRAGDLGVSLIDISRTLETLLASRRVTTFVMGGREYDVILEGEHAAQRTLTDLQDIYVRSSRTGELIPLSNLVTLFEQADAGQMYRYNRVRAVTLSASLAPDYALGDALAYLENLVRSELPAEASFDYKGESLEYKTAGSSVVFTFVLALLVVYLVMAAQFESLVHPFIILLTVPLALIGGLGGLLLFDQTLNIYSQVGLIMLVGLATKNGILIVEFINQLRDQGEAFEQAILMGASTRLRPIAMTGLTTVMGALPLVLSSGPGHEARMVIGVVVMCGVATASVITLLAIPVAYNLLAR